MSYRRLAAAAIIFLAAVYLKYALPSFGAALLPALQEEIGEEQAVIPLPESLSSWLPRS